MSRIPYLARRGNVFHFRIDVPAALRAHIGAREIVRTLSTQDRRVAVPRALEYGAIVKQLFARLRDPNMTKESMMQLLEQAKLKLRADQRAEELEDQIAEAHEQRVREVRQARLEAENAALRAVLHGQGSPLAPLAPLSLSQPGEPEGGVSEAVPEVKLGQVIEVFLKTFDPAKKPMLNKLNAVMPLLLESVGDKPIRALRQSDLNEFFAFVCNLPPRWSDEVRKRKIHVRELAREANPERKTISMKTFESTYVAAVSLLLRAGRRDWADDGFPRGITVEGARYTGNTKDAGMKQRAFTNAELERLFHSSDLMKFKGQPDQAHKFWLPAIGLCTGARVNEICQLNPQSDVLQEKDTDIWHFWITTETEGDERITKSTKKETSKRRVPMHSMLIEAGFLDYLARVKAAGSKLLFPEWKPTRGRSSPAAEKWFCDLLQTLELRDETPGKRIVGMHAFRSTLLHRAKNSSPRIDAGEITGHVGTESAVQRGYEDELALVNKQKLLEAIEFGFVL